MDDLKLALLINAVSPGVGGVLVRGEKGTAKSTIVRAVAALLPDLAVIADCRFSCDPSQPDPQCPDGPHAEADAAALSRPARLVELPVGASEDRLAGALDLERALTDGVTAFEPGLLAQAHRGVLYVDEVNLLHDHLVDLLLDAAAMGTSHVEREGVSVRHAARFLLVGTMNPEEGELRPQLLDRFGLTVEVSATREPDERAEVVRRRIAYDADPEGFAAHYAATDAELAKRIRDAQERLADIALTDDALRQVTSVCAAFDVDGLRADLVTARAAMALAAWRDHDEVTTEDIRDAARLALPHRRRRDPFDAPGLDEDRLSNALDQAGDVDPKEPEESEDSASDPPTGPGTEPDPREEPKESSPRPGPPEPTDDTETGSDDEQPRGSGDAAQDLSAPGETYRPRLLRVAGLGEGAPGRRSRARTAQGRVVGARRPEGRLGRPHLTATLRAAAPHQRARGRSAGQRIVLARDDLRAAIREGKEGNLVLFCVDASGSMAARARMRAVKGAVLSLLLDAYQRRDKVGLVTFRATGAEVALPPTSSVEVGARRLRELRTGGRTPLAAGLAESLRVLDTERRRDPNRRPLLIVVTDGRATAGPRHGSSRVAATLAARGVDSVVVDCESGPVRLGLAGALGTELGATTVRLDQMGADSLTGLVHGHRTAATV
ncbi:putative cobaltochelatase [Spiractinospora alimapuensis]|uniref:putative cobaltochelatase n=1 Tax=Spiractinospora alimapuensis TaxID=2820884 RepID=UPI003742EF7C